MRSLAAPPPAPGLRLSEESQDEATLRQLSTDATVIRRSRDRSNLMRLWEVCQTPDFRKTTQDEHARLVGGMFEHLTQGDRRLPEDWMHGQFASLDRVEGDIDALSTRLARVRTLAYVANRVDWLADPQTWQGRARALEDRLSDMLHQSLMQRFVDRRTSALLRSLNQSAGPILGGIDPDGAVTVEGHLVGRLAGVHFEPERGASALENRALRAAVERVVAPEIARRLGELASEGDAAFALKPGGGVDWRGEAAGEISGGAPFAPRVRLIGEFGAEPQRERATRRLEAFVAAETSRRLFALKQLKEAIEDGRLKGLARGLAYQLVEQSGALDRRVAETRIRMLSRNERRTLKGLGVRFGAFSLYLPSLLAPEAELVGAAYAELARPGWRPEPGALTALPHPAPLPEALSLRGLRAVGGLAAPIAELERLDALARAALPDGAGAVELTPALLADLRWRPEDAEHVLRALGFVRVRKGESDDRPLWRRRAASAKTKPSGLAATPFAALAALAKPSPRPSGERAAGRPGAALRRDAALRDGRRLPDRRLAVARALLQDQKPRRAYCRGRRRPARARRGEDADLEAEPRGAAGRCSHLRPRPAWLAVRVEALGRATRSRARGAGAVLRFARFRGMSGAPDKECSSVAPVARANRINSRPPAFPRCRKSDPPVSSPSAARRIVAEPITSPRKTSRPIASRRRIASGYMPRWMLSSSGNSWSWARGSFSASSTRSPSPRHARAAGRACACPMARSRRSRP